MYNTLRFKGHREITRRFVYRTIKRFKESNSVSLPPRKSKNLKITDFVKKKVIQHVTNKKKPKYTRTLRKTAEVPHGPPKKKVTISHISIEHIKRIWKPHHSKKARAWMENNNIEFSEAPPRPCWRQRRRCEAPVGFWFPAYAPEVSPAELYNNYVQQELDKMTQRLGFPSTLEILRSRVRKIARKPQSRTLKT